MPKFVVVNPDFLTETTRAGQIETPINNGQVLLRVNDKNEDYFRNYKKYSEQEARNLLLNPVGRFKEKHSEAVSPASLTPIVSIKKAEGDYNTIVTPNFCDSGNTFTLQPQSDERIYLVRSEIQLEHDLDFAGDTAVLSYYVWHPAFTDPVIGQQIVCTSPRGLFEIGNAHYTCPPIGTMTNHLTTIQFDQETELVLYGNRKDLNLAYVTVNTGSGNPLGGTYLTVSFIIRTEKL